MLIFQGKPVVLMCVCIVKCKRGLSFNVKNKDREKAFYQAVLGKIEGFYFSYYDTTTTKTL